MSPGLPAGRLTRRIAVASIINFARDAGAATWQLVDVTEHDDRTVIAFDLTYPIRDVRGCEVQRVAVTIVAVPVPSYPGEQP